METAKRTSNSIRNSLFGIGSQIIIVLIGFFTRSVFLKYLSEDYLGLNGLFSNVISILSLTELGFGTAAIFSLYKPLAEKDEQKVADADESVRQDLPRHVRRRIDPGPGSDPFYSVSDKDMPEATRNIYVIYLLFVLNSRPVLPVRLQTLAAVRRSAEFQNLRRHRHLQNPAGCGPDHRPGADRKLLCLPDFHDRPGVFGKRRPLPDGGSPLPVSAQV